MVDLTFHEKTLFLKDYIGQDVYVENQGIGILKAAFYLPTLKLHLTPWRNNCVVSFKRDYWPNPEDIWLSSEKIFPVLREFSDLKSDEISILESINFSFDDLEYKNCTGQQFQYLKSINIQLPLFISHGHHNNGELPIDIYLANTYEEIKDKAEGARAKRNYMWEEQLKRIDEATSKSKKK